MYIDIYKLYIYIYNIYIYTCYKIDILRWRQNKTRLLMVLGVRITRFLVAITAGSCVGAEDKAKPISLLCVFGHKH